MRIVVAIFTTLISAAAAMVVVYLWLGSSHVGLEIRRAELLGSLAELEAASASAGETTIAGCFKEFPGVERGGVPGSWPGFRGRLRDNLEHGSVALAREWPDEGPPIVWQIEVGDGHAMPALSEGCLYLLDYDEPRGGDVIRALNADTGVMLWEYLYPVKIKRNHGISRTVAATDGSGVVTLGPRCHVVCLSVESGDYRWGFNMVQRYGTKVPLWYAGQCPLIDNGMVVLAPAGEKVLLCGVDIASGETLFETPNTSGLQMSHSSVMVLEVEGVRQYIYAALGGVVGVAAEGEEQGKVLWKSREFTPSVVAPSPLPMEDGHFFMTAGYGSGGAMFRVERGSGAEWQARVVFKTDKRQFACEQQTPLYLDGLLYSVLPSDGGTERQQLVCMTPGGERLWASGRDDTFGLGPYLATSSGLMLLMNDSGTLTLAEVSRQGFRRLARHVLMDGKGRDAWGPMILAEGRLYLRDSTRLYCLDLRENR